ncbi:hypothetical protein CAG69_03205 [Vibrio sp. V43_P6S15P86]|nr:hypothetical protein [Vibrio sp. V43_P6S15P86]
MRHCPHLFTFSVNNFVKNSIQMSNSVPSYNKKNK